MQIVLLENTVTGEMLLLRPSVQSPRAHGGLGYTQLKCPHGKPVFPDSPPNDGDHADGRGQHMGHPDGHSFVDALAVAILEDELLALCREITHDTAIDSDPASQ